MNLLRLAALVLALAWPGLAGAQRGTPTFDSVGGDTASGIDARNALYAGGMKCDNTTDDTAAFQAVVNAGALAGGQPVILPGGTCVISGITISYPVIIQGQGKWQTNLRLPAGTTNPAISISITTGAFPSTSGFGDVTLRDFQISSNNRSDAPGQTLAHGISLLQPASPATTEVRIDHVLIQGVPGDCVHSGPFTGFAVISDIECAYPGGYGIAANSASDWTLYGGQIYGAILDNVVLSGTTNFRFTSVNLFVGLKTDFNIFNSDFVCVNCMVDTTGTDNVFVNNQNGRRVDFIGSRFRRAGANTNATYSGIHLPIGNTGNVYLTGSRFDTPASGPNVNKPLNNIQFDAGNTGSVYVDNVSFDLGNVYVAGVSNVPNSILGWTSGRTVSEGANIVQSATQFTGYRVTNGTNISVALFGSSASNDGGSLQLSTGGAVRTNLSAGTPGYTLDGYSVGTTATPQSGGVVVGGHISTGGLFQVPSVAAGATECGTAPTILGNDNAGRVTVGSGTNGGHCTVTFVAAWPTAPICMETNETSTARPVYSLNALTTRIVLWSATTLTAGDVLTYSCRGIQ